jgi:hypothetical protein
LLNQEAGTRCGAQSTHPRLRDDEPAPGQRESVERAWERLWGTAAGNSHRPSRDLAWEGDDQPDDWQAYIPPLVADR